jgi:hypothetical protein
MGIDIYWMFQAHKNGEWIDVSSEYDGVRDYPLYAWLRQEVLPGVSARGFPADFQVDEHSRHPVGSADLLPAHWRKLFGGDRLYVPMGEWGRSWLSGAEILNAETKPEFAYFLDEVRRLTHLHGSVRFVFGFA